MIRPWVHFPEYNICMAFIPKVANTSMKMAFAQLKNMEQFTASQEGIHSHFIGVSPEQIRVFDCPKFMFVRNPFDRLVSAWQSKLIDKESHPSWNRYGFHKDMLFERFAERVCDIPDDLSDHHWRSQSYELGDLQNVNIYKFEEIGIGWGQLQQYVDGLPDLPRWGASQKEDYRVYYTDRLVKLVSNRYKQDLVKFNYEF